MQFYENGISEDVHKVSSLQRYGVCKFLSQYPSDDISLEFCLTDSGCFHETF